MADLGHIAHFAQDRAGKAERLSRLVTSNATSAATQAFPLRRHRLCYRSTLLLRKVVARLPAVGEANSQVNNGN
jgi:hypothetical protein